MLNDRPDLVAACGADGVHVGQDDDTPAAARAAVGPERIVGRSTHAPAQADAAAADPDVDYLAVGPVHATPTKPGRPAAGLEYVEYAARTVTKPWFAIGGLDASTSAPRSTAARAGSSSCARSPRRPIRRPRRARCAARWRAAGWRGTRVSGARARRASRPPRPGAPQRPPRGDGARDDGARLRPRPREGRGGARRARADRARRAAVADRGVGDPRRAVRGRQPGARRASAGRSTASGRSPAGSCSPP